jgi:mannitol-1-phosphate/altronate dehydrogenase
MNSIFNDPEAEAFYKLQQQYAGKELVKAVLGKTDWWMMDLNELPGFSDAVSKQYKMLME